MENIRRKMTRFSELITLEEAISRIKTTDWRAIETETIRTEESSGRIASEDIVARKPYPEWNRSLVDGYAVKSSYCNSATETNPVRLKINGIIEAGSSSYSSYIEGMCTEIYTGGILPDSYDCVVMAEDVETRGDTITVLKKPRPWENVERKGEDIKVGKRITGKSSLVRPWHISAMLSSGVEEVKVYRRLKIGVLATGNELFRGSEGYIPNTTQGLFTNYLNRPFLETKPAGIAHDSAEEIYSMAANALRDLDCLIVTGGTSLGGKDEVPEAITGFGRAIFAGCMIRPGRTLTLYESEGKPVFSVSGIPVPSLLSFDLFFEEYLVSLLSFTQYRRTVTGKLSNNITNKAGYAGIYRVKISPLSGGNEVEIVKSQGTGNLGSILESDGTLLIPAKIEGYEPGQMVLVKLYGDAQ